MSTKKKPPSKTGRKRWMITPLQQAFLTAVFETLTQFPTVTEQSSMAVMCGKDSHGEDITPAHVRVWFQNRRQRDDRLPSMMKKKNPKKNTWTMVVPPPVIPIVTPFAALHDPRAMVGPDMLFHGFPILGHGS